MEDRRRHVAVEPPRLECIYVVEEVGDAHRGSSASFCFEGCAGQHAATGPAAPWRSAAATHNASSSKGACERPSSSGAARADRLAFAQPPDHSARELRAASSIAAWTRVGELTLRIVNASRNSSNSAPVGCRVVQFGCSYCSPERVVARRCEGHKTGMGRCRGCAAYCDVVATPDVHQFAGGSLAGKDCCPVSSTRSTRAASRSLTGLIWMFSTVVVTTKPRRLGRHVPRADRVLNVTQVPC